MMREELIDTKNEKDVMIAFWKFYSVYLNSLQIKTKIMVFFSQHFKCITPFSSHLHGFLGEIKYHSSICSPIGKVFFPLDCFRMFSLSLTFCNFTVMGIGVFWHLPCFVFSDFPGSVMVSGINLGKFSVTIVSNSSIFFSFFWYSHYVYGTPFVTVPQS